jgi:hypothetical protein
VQAFSSCQARHREETYTSAIGRRAIGRCNASMVQRSHTQDAVPQSVLHCARIGPVCQRPVAEALNSKVSFHPGSNTVLLEKYNLPPACMTTALQSWLGTRDPSRRCPGWTSRLHRTTLLRHDCRRHLLLPCGLLASDASSRATRHTV